MGFNRFYLIGFLLILALPLLSLPPWFAPPDWGKTIVFRIILSVLIFFFLYQASKNKERLIVPQKAKTGLYLFLALLGIYFLATIFSLDTNFSLWGSPYRGGGFVNFAFYIIFALLAFFVLKKEDWQKIWDFAILTGALVSVVAIFQWQGWFADIVVTYANRPPSTLGNPIMLALYLLLLSFLALSFGIKADRLYKKLLYFSVFALFVFAILLTYSRAAYLGLTVGLVYFFFFYPLKRRAFSLALKLTLLTIIAAGSLAVYYINTGPELPEFIQENRTLRGMVSRLSWERAVQNPRVSGWKVGWQALKDRPLLGYGPENFAIGFDRHYDPSLPGIGKRADVSTESWWDRAHNLVLDIAVTAGIPALIIFLALIFVIFWQLQKVKRITKQEHRSAWLAAHAIQAAFIGYLIANFFSFDAFSIYLILFLLVSYSLYLISSLEKSSPAVKQAKIRMPGHRKLWLAVIFVLLIWFIFSFNLKPLQINKEVNVALYEAENNHCEQAISRMENLLPQKTFLGAHLRLEYADILAKCKDQMRELGLEIVKKGASVMREAVELRPYHSSNYVVLGSFLNSWIEHEADEKTLKDLKKEADVVFETAQELSPKRQDFLVELIKNNIITGQYEKAEENAQKCIALNETFRECWWFLALSNIYLDQEEEAEKNIEEAKKRGYPVKSEDSLLMLATAYVKKENYPQLKDIYRQLTEIYPDNANYHASLAIVYRELGEFENARKAIKKALELAPGLKEEIEEFLRQLP